MDYPWYKILEKETLLNQGDFIPECPIVIPPKELAEGLELNIDVQLINSIVLTQSCDLVNDKAQIVLVCPFYSLSEFIEQLPDEKKTRKAIKRIVNDIRKGYLPSYHLLDSDSNISEFEDYKVVDFRNVYGIQFDALVELISGMENRVRLLPPYREHLSQAFARYFMRVGLPQDIVVEGY